MSDAIFRGLTFNCLHSKYSPILFVVLFISFQVEIFLETGRWNSCCFIFFLFPLHKEIDANYANDSSNIEGEASRIAVA